jgi:hypothetical protein
MQKELPAKYLKALQLIQSENYSYKEIAKMSGIQEDVFYDLVEGNSEKYGEAGQRFSSELDKHYKKVDKDIREMTKKNKKTCQYLIDDYLSKAKRRKKVDQSLISTLTSITKALAQSTPHTEIGTLAFTQGLNIEDIYAEFKRLNAIAFERRGLQGLESAGERKLPVESRESRSITQEPEDSSLRTESQD